ncbi:MAG: L-histidine N(alpha)-methyltransferase [Rubrivivax sp.]
MSTFAEEFVAGLRARVLAPKWFYDAAGAQLFERICELPEYYPTRTEIALLDHLAPLLAGRIGPGAEIVEFGAGASVKVRLLLDALRQPRRFIPVDMSQQQLLDAAARLRRDYPGLEVLPQVADFTAALQLPPASGRRLGFFPGSSIGNFEPEAAEALLRRFAASLQGGALLVGVDLVKEPALLHAAYNDATGVTAAFNLNLLVRANRELGADFVPAQWAHSAFYQPRLQRIEMHLVSRCVQTVTLAGERFDFAEGESMHTENSYKYSVDGFQALARRAGLRPTAAWTDAARRFSLHWLESGSTSPKEDNR